MGRTAQTARLRPAPGTPDALDRRGMAMVAAAAMSWGLWSLFVRPTALPAAATAPIVMAFIGVVSLALVPLEGAPARWDRTSIGLLLANTAFDALNLVTFFAAMDHTTVAIAVLTHYLAPVLVAAAAPTIERTRIPGIGLAATGALVGLALILQPWRPENRAGDLALGASLGAISAVAYAGNVFVVRRLAPRVGAARAVAYHSLLAAAVLAPLGLVHVGAIEAVDLALLAAGAATLGAGSGIVYARGLSRIGSARASVLTFLEPLVAVVVGYLVWREPLGAPAFAGGALVLAAGLWTLRVPAPPR